MAKTKVGMVKPTTRVSPKSVKDLRNFDEYELDEYLHREHEQLRSHRVVRKKPN